MGFKNTEHQLSFVDLSVRCTGNTLFNSVARKRAITRPVPAILEPEMDQINDCISFKKFLGLPPDQTSPDHSTFSRFRSRLSQGTMKAGNHELLSQFASRGLTINEGIAIDARLVQFASRPLERFESKIISCFKWRSKEMGQLLRQPYQ